MPGGENTNKSGLPFEDQVKQLFFNKEMANGDDYTIGGKKFKFFMKRALHKHLVKHGMYNSDDWEHCKEPDFALIDEKKETLFIFEVKYQMRLGSCDEKIRGANSLRREYKEDLYPKVKHVYMCYIFNSGQEKPCRYIYGFGLKRLKIPIRQNQENDIPSFFAKKDDNDNRYRRKEIKLNDKEIYWLAVPLQYQIDVNAIENWILSKLQSSTHPDSLSV
tara:strand:- start:45 stop:701 length:657 start_codon:yes stop_codon:yes gene_type:complete